MLPNIAGLNVFEMDQVGKEIMSYIIRQKLTHQLADLIGPLCEEASDALQQSWTDNPGAIALWYPSSIGLPLLTYR
jgi:hypothetical protein